MKSSKSRRQNFSVTTFSRRRRSSRRFAGKAPNEFNIVLDRTACYAEMGGQVGDHGLLHVPGHDRSEVGQLAIKDTQKRGDIFVHTREIT